MQLQLTQHDVETLARALSIARLILEGEAAKQEVDELLASLPLSDEQLEMFSREAVAALDKIVSDR